MSEQLSLLGTPRGIPVTIPVRHDVRVSDPETSHRAALYNLGHRSDQRAKVLDNLIAAGENGLTDFEHPGIQQQSAGKRRLELQADGLVTFKTELVDDRLVKVRRRTPSGAWSQVWVAVL